jgi:hypothetical protein
MFLQSSHTNTELLTQAFSSSRITHSVVRSGDTGFKWTQRERQYFCAAPRRGAKYARQTTGHNNACGSAVAEQTHVWNNT